jgi:protein SCO1/2
MKRLLRSPWIWGFLIGIVTITAMRPFLRHVPDPPPVLAQLPAWELVDSGGRPYGSDDLAGTVYVVGFFTTDCDPGCPDLMRSMSELQARYDRTAEEDIRLVGISVDPARDTADRLADHAERYGVNPGRWTLVAGDPELVEQLVLGGFRNGPGEQALPGTALLQVADAGKLVLVDRAGGIRGYYGTDEMGLDEIFHRSRHVRDRG